MSEIKVNKISPRTACGTTTLGDSGDTFTIPAGATITNAGTASGFGATGETSWDTTVKTNGTFTATAGVGYFCNTTAGTITVNLPAGAAGSSVALADYAATWDDNKVTVSPNGSEKIGGTNADVILNTEGQSVTFVYIDGTQGWVNVLDSTSNVRANEYLVATGGTQTTSGDYKIHTFTGPGTFTVCKVACAAANNIVDYVVVAGGGGGGSGCASGGGGGAGGFRFFANTPTNPQTGPGAPRNGYGSPTPSGTQITVTATGYPIAVGGGGNGGDGCAPGPGSAATIGVNSTFSTVTSAGGGYGAPGSISGPYNAADGGSGGGPSRGRGTAGAGNTPPVTPTQGNDSGDGSDPLGGDGGGGAMAVGAANGPTPGSSAGLGGSGGAGAGITGFGTSGQVCGGVYYFSGGGGGGTFVCGTCTQKPGDNARGGIGGGGPGSLAPTHPASPNKQVGIAGTSNTGGGGGGGGEAPIVGTTPLDADGGNGGSGIVIIRYKYQ